MCALKCLRLNVSNIYQTNTSIILQCNVYNTSIIRSTYLVVDTFDKIKCIKITLLNILNIFLLMVYYSKCFSFSIA